MVLGVPLPRPHNWQTKIHVLEHRKFPTQVAVERHLEAFVLKLNCENPTLAILEPTFNAIVDRSARGCNRRENDLADQGREQIRKKSADDGRNRRL